MMLTVIPIFLLVLCCHTLLRPCATTQTMAANEVNPNQHFSSNPTKRATSPLQKSLHMEAEILCKPCIACCFFKLQLYVFTNSQKSGQKKANHKTEQFVERSVKLLTILNFKGCTAEILEC